MNVRETCDECSCWAVIPPERVEGWQEDHQLGHPHSNEIPLGLFLDEEQRQQEHHLDAIEEEAI